MSLIILSSYVCLSACPCRRTFFDTEISFHSEALLQCFVILIHNTAQNHTYDDQDDLCRRDYIYRSRK